MVEEGGQVGNYVNGGGGIKVSKYSCIPSNFNMGGGVVVPAFGSLEMDNYGRVVVLKAKAKMMYVLRGGRCVLTTRYDVDNLLESGA